RPSKRHGRGKRWRVRWSDPHTGETRTTLFERKADAERHDASVHADISRGQYIEPRAGKITIAEYASQGRTHQLHRDSTAEIVERAFRLHILPMLGSLPIAEARSSHLALARHIERRPIHEIVIEGRADIRNIHQRSARLLFLTAHGGPLHRPNWSAVWRAAVRRAGLPPGFSLHGFRHYFATLLIHNGAAVKTVQVAPGHSTPIITLNTYAHEWPDALDRTRTLVDAALGPCPPAAAVGPNQ
ncbi:MAG: hypothetical protein QOG46_1367, partial [Pseudonocardiales bacterium]|nr:hypothetical protein [Pseudonocardiales bacterium]